jgi:hypothetical protein
MILGAKRFRCRKMILSAVGCSLGCWALAYAGYEEGCGTYNRVLNTDGTHVMTVGIKYGIHHVGTYCSPNLPPNKRINARMRS